MTEANLIYLIIGLVLQTAVIVGTGVWRLSQVKVDIFDRLDKKIEGVEKKFESLQGEIHGELESIRREYRDSFLALREKITQVEIWSRDNFVRRESFFQVVDGFREQLKAMGDNINAQLQEFRSLINRIAPPTIQPPRDST